MQNYKDLNNKVHVLDDVAFTHLLPAGCVPITDEEAASLAPKPIPLPAADQIDQIERTTLMNRAVREFLLLSSEAQAAAQGVTPVQLYGLNPAYRKVKDVDNQIAALRASL